MRELEARKDVIRERLRDLHDHFNDLTDEAILIEDHNNERLQLIYDKKCKIHEKIKRLNKELDSLISQTN